ncbi:MAG TPA: hypothetical protein VNU01_09255 [Egibacteraceae bacterium]|nr:hypothetical protein [Egibacteraceae bacterium]
MRRRAWIRLLVVLPLLAALAVLDVSDAVFTGGTSNGGSSFEGDTLAPPSGVTVTHQCLLSIQSVKVDWTASPSTWATHYRVLRAVNGGAYASVATVSYGTDTWTDSGVSASTTYTYRVRTERTGWTWTSVEAQSADVTTPALCL